MTVEEHDANYMNWNLRYAAENKLKCIFCNGLNHWSRTAKNWTEENSSQTGLPRPSVATESLALPNGENAQNNWRKRTVIPWSARPLHVDPKDVGRNTNSLQLVTPESGLSLNVAPAPIPEREEMVRTHRVCAMCGEHFKPNDFTVRFNGFHDSVESDHFPMHQECMRQTVSFCPHMKEYGNDFSQLQSGKSKFFSRGAFKYMFGKAVNQTQFRRRSGF